jgi:hypothetical protein
VPVTQAHGLNHDDDHHRVTVTITHWQAVLRHDPGPAGGRDSDRRNGTNKLEYCQSPPVPVTVKLNSVPAPAPPVTDLTAGWRLSEPQSQCPAPGPGSRTLQVGRGVGATRDFDRDGSANLKYPWRDCDTPARLAGGPRDAAGHLRDARAGGPGATAAPGPAPTTSYSKAKTQF